MKKRKLLIGTDNYPPRWDGIARFLNELLPELKKEYEITVLAPKFRKVSQEDKEGIRVVRLKTFPFQVGDFTPAKFHFRKIKREVKKADIVWIQDLGTTNQVQATQRHLGSKNQSQTRTEGSRAKVRNTPSKPISSTINTNKETNLKRGEKEEKQQTKR